MTAIRQDVSNFQLGLSKLELTQEQVIILEEKIQEMAPQLELQKEKVQKAYDQLEIDRKIAQQQENVVQQEADIVNQQAFKIKTIFDEANKELDLVTPEYERAQQAVQNIDRNSLTIMKGYAAPPEAPRVVMEACFILLGLKYSWQAVKVELQDLNGFI